MGNTINVVTGKNTRFSYANLLEPRSYNGGPERYGASLIIPKSDTPTIDKINTAIDAAYSAGAFKLAGNGKKVPPLDSIHTPLRDGDVERPDDEAYKNSFFLNANSNRPPQIVDAKCRPVTDPSEVYSGVYGRASISFYAYNVNGNRGIACGLNGVQVLKKGEPLGAPASTGFTVEESDDDDEDTEDFLQ